MLGFLGGAAKGAQGELEDQDKRAFALKLQSAQIEGQIEKEKAILDYSSASEAATADMSGGVETGRANPQTQAWWTSKNKNEALLRKPVRGMNYDRKALIDAMIKNPEAYDDLTATAKADIFPDLQAKGFKRKAKPLSDGMQVRADAASSGLKAMERVNARLNVNSDEFLKLYAPGSIGAKNLRGDLGEIMDIVMRIRTGAALNKDELTHYRSQLISDDISSLLEDLADGRVDGESIKYRMNTIYKPYLEDMAKMQERRERNVVEDVNPMGTADDAAAWRAKRNAPKVQ